MSRMLAVDYEKKRRAAKFEMQKARHDVESLIVMPDGRVFEPSRILHRLEL